MRFLLLALIPLLAALGWCAGPYLCLWLYDGEVYFMGGSAGALGFGFLALGALLPRYRVLLFPIPGALGLVGNLAIVVALWNVWIHHGLLLVYGVPLLLSGILLFVRLVALRQQSRSSIRGSHEAA